MEEKLEFKETVNLNMVSRKLVRIMGSKRAGIRMIHQEPDTWKFVRPVLRGGKPVRVYLSRQGN